MVIEKVYIGMVVTMDTLLVENLMKSHPHSGIILHISTSGPAMDSSNKTLLGEYSLVVVEAPVVTETILTQCSLLDKASCPSDFKPCLGRCISMLSRRCVRLEVQ